MLLGSSKMELLRNRLSEFAREKRYAVLVVLGCLVLVAAGVWFFRSSKESGKHVEKISAGDNVTVPSIVDGQLVLPSVATGSASGLSGKAAVLAGKLGVISANLIPVFDQSQKLSAIRVVGEAQNITDETVTGISAYVRFLDAQGQMVGQKLGSLSPGYDLFGFGPNERGYYDVTVEAPPSSDRLEIVLNTTAATTAAEFDELKIASRSMEIKKAVASGAAATESANTSFDYYTVGGSVVNPFSDPVSNITVYGWVRDKEGKVFGFARQDFKNDLISSGEKLDFKLNILPLRNGEKYDSYELAAWGKKYRLNL